MKNDVLLDTYCFSQNIGEDYFYFEELLQDSLDRVNDLLSITIKRYEKRFRTSVVGLFFDGSRSSHYGLIGGNGAKGGFYYDETELYLHSGNKWIKVGVGCDHQVRVKHDGLFDRLGGEHMKISVVDNKLVIETFDHDGTNSVVARFVTEREKDFLEEREFISPYGNDECAIRDYIVTKKQPFVMC